MTTLIAVYNSDGCVGRCDSRCYQAARPHCTCICGGLNHRAGKSTAMQNVAARVGLELDDVQRFAEKRGLKCEELKAIDRVAIADSRDARMAAIVALTQYDLFKNQPA